MLVCVLASRELAYTDNLAKLRVIRLDDIGVIGACLPGVAASGDVRSTRCVRRLAARATACN